MPQPCRPVRSAASMVVPLRQACNEVLRQEAKAIGVDLRRFPDCANTFPVLLFKIPCSSKSNSLFHAGPSRFSRFPRIMLPPASLRAQLQVRQLQRQPKSLHLERCLPGSQRGLPRRVGPAKFSQPTPSRSSWSFPYEDISNVGASSSAGCI